MADGRSEGERGEGSQVLIHELSDDECRTILARTNLARLCCSRHDQPYVVPVYVYFDDGCFYGFATLGQKIEWMRENPKVCVEIDDVADESTWTTIVAFGRYEEITDAPEDSDARSRARELFERRRNFWLPAAAKLASAEHAAPVVYRIRIDRLTGRSAARHI